MSSFQIQTDLHIFWELVSTKEKNKKKSSNFEMTLVDILV